MGVFTDVEMVWAGKTYTIKSHRVMGAIAQMEQFITLSELAGFEMRGAAPLARLSQAYAAALKYAGCRVDADEIYGALFGDGEIQVSVIKGVRGLMKLMLPAAKRAEIDALEAAAEAGETGDGTASADSGALQAEADPGNAPAAAAALSAKPSNSAAGRMKKAASASSR